MNFALILVVLTFFTGILYALDLLVFRPGRRRRAEAALAQFASQAEPALRTASGDEAVLAARDRILQDHMHQPLWLEYTASFFPVILFVFVLRSFVFEPFKIPSGSMIPTLVVGDLILVNKFIYGLRLPVIDQKILPIRDPQRGDVAVFRYPKDPSLDYIKRIVAVGGDTVSYRQKRLFINGQALDTVLLGDYFDQDKISYAKMYAEKLDGKTHHILIDPEKPGFLSSQDPFPYRDQCEFTSEGFTCKVPQGHYFAMGDNRDNSSDSRYWGFVPDRYLVGKAFFIWMNFSQLTRIGRFQ